MNGRGMEVESRFSGVIFMSVDIRGQNIDKMTINKMCARCFLTPTLSPSILFRFSSL